MMTLPLLTIVGCTPNAEVIDAVPTIVPTLDTSPSPSPEPSVSPSPAVPSGPPSVSSLVITPEGMNGLVIGEPIPASMATWDPQGCRPGNENQADYFAEDDPVWQAFIPTYDTFTYQKDGYTHEAYPFEPHHDENGNLRWLRVRSDQIRSDRGIGIGSSEADVRSAYPDAEVFLKGAGDAYRTYNITGETGRLVIEIAGAGFEYGAAPTVWTMYLESPDEELHSIGGGDAGGFCALGV